MIFSRILRQVAIGALYEIFAVAGGDTPSYSEAVIRSSQSPA